MTVEPHTTERAILEAMRHRLENEGYEFIIYPPAEVVPSFLGRYRPDAIALKADGGGIVIEVKTGQSGDARLQLASVAKLFEDEEDWAFRLVRADDSPVDTPEISWPTRDQIEKQLTEVQALGERGHLRAALGLAWATLEAAERLTGASAATGDAGATMPSALAESLAHSGVVSDSGAIRLRELARLRNAAMHGDFGSAVTKDDIVDLSELIRRVLSVEQAA